MSAAPAFRVRVEVRHSDVDRNGHVTTAAYLQFADHARWQLLDAAGVDIDAVTASGFGPVTLETRIRFLRELAPGGAVDVSCAFTWGDGKTGAVVQQLRRGEDGELAAEVESVGGVLDLARRRLVGSPAEFWRPRCARPELLGLAEPG